MNTAKKIYEKVKILPDSQRKEVLNFIDFIASKQRQEPLIKQESILKYAGILKDSPNFNDDPVNTQRALRDDWR